MPDPETESPSTVRATFSIPVGGVFLQASAQLPVGRTTLTELLPIIQNLENVVTGRVMEEARTAGSPISCQAGCGACCRQMVPVSLFEAEALMEWMRSLPPQRQRQLEERFHRALTALRDAGVIDKLLDTRWLLDEGFATDVSIEYFRAHVACPFLENENCGIYSIRPLACREYMVTSPPALCQDPAANDVWGLQIPLKLSRVLFAFGRAMEHDVRGWIPLVFLMAWTKGGAHPGEYVTGTGEELLQQFLNKAAELVKEEKN